MVISAAILGIFTRKTHTWFDQFLDGDFDQ